MGAVLWWVSGSYLAYSTACLRAAGRACGRARVSGDGGVTGGAFRDVRVCGTGRRGGAGRHNGVGVYLLLDDGKKIGLAVICCPCNTNPRDAGPTACSWRLPGQAPALLAFHEWHPRGDSDEER